VKKRELKDIKNGEKIMLTLVLSARGSESFSEIQSKTGLDRKAVQKGLADLQKAGFVSKNDQSFWTITPGTALSEIVLLREPPVPLPDARESGVRAVRLPGEACVVSGRAHEERRSSRKGRCARSSGSGRPAGGDNGIYPTENENREELDGKEAII